MDYKYFYCNGTRYGCRVVEEYCEPGLRAIRITSNRVGNVYFWRDGYVGPAPCSNNIKEFDKEAILIAFKKLDGCFKECTATAESSTAVPASTTIPQNKVADNSCTMFKVTNTDGSFAMFTSCEDVVKYSIGKTVSIEEVSVTINNTTIATEKEVVKEELATIPKEKPVASKGRTVSKKEKSSDNTDANTPIQDVNTQEQLPKTNVDKVDSANDDNEDDYEKPVIINTGKGRNRNGRRVNRK